MCKPGGNRCASSTRKDLTKAKANNMIAVADEDTARTALQHAITARPGPRDLYPEENQAVDLRTTAAANAMRARDKTDQALLAARIEHAKTPTGRAETATELAKAITARRPYEETYPLEHVLRTADGHRAAIAALPDGRSDKRKQLRQAKALRTTHEALAVQLQAAQKYERETRVEHQAATAQGTERYLTECLARATAETGRLKREQFEAHVAYARTSYGREDVQIELAAARSSWEYANEGDDGYEGWDGEDNETCKALHRVLLNADERNRAGVA